MPARRRRRAVDDVAQPPRPLCARGRGTGVFPGGSRPRVLWVGTDGWAPRDRAARRRRRAHLRAARVSARAPAVPRARDARPRALTARASGAARRNGRARRPLVRSVDRSGGRSLPEPPRRLGRARATSRSRACRSGRGQSSCSKSSSTHGTRSGRSGCAGRRSPEVCRDSPSFVITTTTLRFGTMIHTTWTPRARYHRPFARRVRSPSSRPATSTAGAVAR